MAVPKDALGRLIGPGGSSINALQDRTQARIVVLDAGAVHYFAPNAQQAAAVKSSIEALTGTGLQVGPCQFGLLSAPSSWQMHIRLMPQATMVMPTSRPLRTLHNQPCPSLPEVFLSVSLQHDSYHSIALR